MKTFGTSTEELWTSFTLLINSFSRVMQVFRFGKDWIFTISFLIDLSWCWAKFCIPSAKDGIKCYLTDRVINSSSCSRKSSFFNEASINLLKCKKISLDQENSGHRNLKFIMKHGNRRLEEEHLNMLNVVCLDPTRASAYLLIFHLLIFEPAREG